MQLCLREHVYYLRQNERSSKIALDCRIDRQQRDVIQQVFDVNVGFALYESGPYKCLGLFFHAEDTSRSLLQIADQRFHGWLIPCEDHIGMRSSARS